METQITLPGQGKPVVTKLDDFATTSRVSGGGLGALTQADFLRLLTTQLANQDPLEPVSNEDMLAQMAQFSSLEAETRTSQTITEIAGKIDALVKSQEAALAAEKAAREAEAASAQELSAFEEASLAQLGLISQQLSALTELQQATLAATSAALADEDDEPAAPAPASASPAPAPAAATTPTPASASPTSQPTPADPVAPLAAPIA